MTAQQLGRSAVSTLFGQIPLDRIDMPTRYRGLNQGFQDQLQDILKKEGYTPNSVLSLAYEDDGTLELIDGSLVP